ncbi:methylmalonyl-CoA mutase small subunit [Tessaracoccus antarcticus]|uniref:Methylmalonyl-CoA mutase small subunit n=1 Tax=Tessaracoccus antarcticus TaxID=2479848 RepID=A0A3M0GG98_9ACTN|nr:methylmalonyl-CoA mutase small subunit [Tessaracoccus antarcticus]RMB61732.1 methylmalonyl-CoA mutase small subunit [Tessaracoccus antarcticus]
MSAEATSAAEITLAADFTTPTQADWEKEVLKVLNRKRPEGKELTIEQAYKRLTSHTVDGITIKPLYTAEDGVDELGFPGIVPFTRGTTVRTGEMDAWHVAPLHETPDADATRRAILSDLEQGATSVWLRVDPDAIALADVPTVLTGVLLDLAPIHVSSRTDQLAAATAVLEVLDKDDADNSTMGGSLGIDPIGFAALHGTTPDLSVLAEAVKIAKPFPGIRPIVVDAGLYHNAGAGDIAELAYAIATGVEYVRALVDAGVSVDEAFDSILFRVSATTDQFLTIARLRALRLLWSRIGEVLEVTPAKRGAVQHAVTSLREITRDDAYVNVLRATIAAFGASAGGAETQTTLPLDSAIGLPNELSRRIARNVQILLAEESNVGRVNDPAGGSWYVESMTRQLSEQAWKLFGTLDEAGFAAAVADGTVKAQLDELNEARRRLLSTRKLPITGVSMFPNPSEELPQREPRPEAPELHGLVPVRDSSIFEALRDRSDAAREAGNPPKVLLACLGARRDFGGREGFTSNLYHVGGIETVLAEGTTPEDFARQLTESGTSIAVLCSSAKKYASQGFAVAKALRDAGAQEVRLAGQLKELGSEDTDGLIAGNVYDGMDVVDLLTTTLDKLEA